MKSDELELLKKAKMGDNESIDKILDAYKHFVITIVRKYYLMGGDKEDLIQEGMIGVFKAITSFDETKNDNFVGYATMLIEREIISAIRRASTANNQVFVESLFFDSDDQIPDLESPESDFISEETTLELTQEINEKLSPFEREVVQLYLKGYNYQDIAKILNKSSKSIDNALLRIKTKLSYLKERL